MARHRRLPIWKSAFDLAVHLENAVRRFPRYHKYGLGQELRPHYRLVRRRVVRLAWQPQPCRPTVSPAEHLSEILSFDSARGLA